MADGGGGGGTGGTPGGVGGAVGPGSGGPSLGDLASLYDYRNLIPSINPSDQPYDFRDFVDEFSNGLTDGGSRLRQKPPAQPTLDNILSAAELRLELDHVQLVHDVELQKSGMLDQLAAPELEKWYVLDTFANQLGFKVTGGKESEGHNTGSLHGAGLAIDIRTWNKAPEEVNRLIRFLLLFNLTIRDERVQPLNQKVWKGAHLHINVPPSGSVRRVLLSPEFLSGTRLPEPPQSLIRDEQPLERGVSYERLP